MTAVPLMLFAMAARRMPYSTLGFTQFLSPTIVFILGPVRCSARTLQPGAAGLLRR